MDRLYFHHDDLARDDLDELYRIAGLYQVVEAAAPLLARLEGPVAALAELRHMRGYCRVETDDLAGGIADYAAAVRLAPEFDPPRRNLAGLRPRVVDRLEDLQRAADWDELLRLASAARTAWPGERRFAWSAAVGLDMTGRAEESAEVLLALAKDAPERDEVWHSLFLVLGRLGREQEAAIAGAEGVRVLRERGLDAETLEGMLRDIAPAGPRWPLMDGGADAPASPPA